MVNLVFGTAGIPRSAEANATVAGIERISELGLDCMELEFVRGIRMNEESARSIAEVAAGCGVKLSAHAPYYVNLNAREPEKILRSQQWLRETARVAALCGADRVVFHPGFYMGDSPERAYENIRDNLREVIEHIDCERVEIRLSPEVMGRVSQFGTVEEIVNLCLELPELMPCLDFAHLHARTAMYNSYEEFVRLLKGISEKLGGHFLCDLHIHLAGIAYGEKGEKHHLNLAESDFNYTELLRALINTGVEGRIISESPNLEEDAHLLKDTYRILLEGKGSL